MDRSRQGHTRNESLRSETPTSYLIFKNTHPQIFLQRLLTPSGGLKRELFGGEDRSWRARAGFGGFFFRVSASAGSAPRPDKREFGLGFLRSHPGFSDEVGRRRRQLIMFRFTLGKASEIPQDRARGFVQFSRCS